MKIELSNEEIELIGDLKNAYKVQKQGRKYSSKTSILALEMKSKDLMTHLKMLGYKHHKEFVAVVKRGSLVLYTKEDNGSLTPVNYCEI